MSSRCAPHTRPRRPQQGLALVGGRGRSTIPAVLRGRCASDLHGPTLKRKCALGPTRALGATFKMNAFGPKNQSCALEPKRSCALDPTDALGPFLKTKDALGPLWWNL